MYVGPIHGWKWECKRYIGDGKMVLRAYSEGALNGTAVTNNPILQPNTSLIAHIEGMRMLELLNKSKKNLPR